MAESGMIRRGDHLRRLTGLLREFPVVGLVAPRQVGKTTLARALTRGRPGGAIAYHELSGFSLAEVDPARLGALWLRGGFPRSFLARTEPASWRWRQQFIRTFLERDLPALGLRLGADTLHRFWAMLAHFHAQVWNASELARAFGVADTTVRGYLDLLASAFMVRLLMPWSENLAKRQVKAPKVYLRDTGLLRAPRVGGGHRLARASLAAFDSTPTPEGSAESEPVHRLDELIDADLRGIERHARLSVPKAHVRSVDACEPFQGSFDRDRSGPSGHSLNRQHNRRLRG